jgi:competence ComEA-like helix-hairpin-helix protein
MNVSGIGEYKYNALKQYVYVDADKYSRGTGSSEKTSGRLTETASVTTKPAPNLPIELNSATLEELTWLPGVNDTMAVRIIVYAEQYGFYSVDDLLNVSGIGEAKLEKIRPYVYVDTSSLPQKSTVTTATPETTAYKPSLPIELNSATIEDLTWLPEIGETTAIKIIVYAQQYGFYSVDDLLNVSGIGKAKLEKIKPYICVDASGLPPKTSETSATTSKPKIVNINTAQSKSCLLLKE